MQLHIHTGPGQHDKILLNELRRNNVSHSYSLYFPSFEYGISEKGKPNLIVAKSKLYDNANKWVWRLKNLTPATRDARTYQDITYPLFDAIISRKISGNNLFFGWAQMSCYCLQKVKRRGGITILEYPIAHVSSWKRYVEQENKYCGIQSGRGFFSERMVRRMLKEIEVADYISVPSTFVRNTFLENGVNKDKLIVNPYGIDYNFFTPEPKNLNNPFTVIAVGTVEARKGCHYLLEVFDKLNLPGAELKIIGKVNPFFESIKRRYEGNASIKFLGRLNNIDTAREMRRADVMVMPSLVEGLSLSILETMSSGTPVISSENAGGLDVISDGKDGLIIPIRDTEQLEEKLEWSYLNRGSLVEMGREARKKIVSYFTIEKYGERAVTILNRFL